MPRLRFLSSLRARLILLVLFALAPAIAILILNTAEHRAREKAEALAQVLTLSQLAARQQEQVLESARQVLISLGEVPEMLGDDPSACTTTLAELASHYESYTGFAVVQPTGDVFCRTTPITTPINVAQNFAFQQALQTGDLAVGEYQIGRASGKPTLGLCYPLQAGEAILQRVICGGIDLGRLNQVAADFQLSPGSTLVIIDHLGTFLVRYPDSETWIGKNLPDEPLTRAMLQEKNAELNLTGPDGVNRLYAMTPLRINSNKETGVVLAVGIPVGLAYQELNRQLVRDLSVLGLVAVLALVLAWWGSDAFILRQVRTLLGAAERLSQGDLSVRTRPGEEGGEINQLSRAFDTMATALEQREHDRRQAEEALRLSLEQLSIILQGVADGIIVLDQAGRLQYTNDAAARLMGYASSEALLASPPTEILQKFEIYDEAGQPFPTNQLPGRKVLQGTPQAQATIRYWNKATGEEHWSLDKSTAVFDAEGRVVMAVNILHDFTEIKRAELSQSLLAEAGRLLATPLDWRTRLAHLTQLAVPRLADWCAVDVIEYKENIQRISVAHVDPTKIEFAYALQQQYPADPHARQGIPEVLRSGVSQFYPSISSDLLEANARDAQHLQLLKTMNLSSIMVVPLSAHGRTLGALSLIWAESGRHYTLADLAVAEEIGRRAGLALDNARLYAETQALNTELEQRIHERTAELLTTNAKLKNEIVERREAQQQLEESQRQLRQLSAHLQAAREAERTHIAGELHDELVQMLTGLKMDVAAVQRALPEGDTTLQPKLERMSEFIDTTLQSIRYIAMELRPGLLDDLGLAAALEWQLGEFGSRTGIEGTFSSNLGDESMLDMDQKTVLFRIFQEALTNVARHAQATTVAVTLEKNQDSLLLQVQDNGRGISSQEKTKPGSFGLLGMQERAHLLGGELIIDGPPEQGTTLRVRVPIRQVSQ